MLARLALRNIRRQRGRTLFTLSVIVLGVVGLILTGGFVEDIFIQLREATIHSRLGHLQVHRAGYHATGRRDPFAYLISAPGELARDLSEIPGVEEVMMRLEFSGLATTGGGELPIIGEGVEPGKEKRLGSALSLVEGRWLEESDTYGVLVGVGVARKLGMKPGDQLTLMASSPEAGLNTIDLEVVGVFKSFSKDYDDRAIRVSLPAAKELLATDGVHSLVFLLQETGLTESVSGAIRARLPAEQYEVMTWDEMADFYRKTVDLYRRQFGVLQLITLVMVILSVTNSVNMAVYERIGEMGTMKALGCRRRIIFRLVLLENLFLGGGGALVGTLVGMTAAWVVSQVGIPMPPPPNSNSGYVAVIPLVPGVIVTAAVVGLSATGLAAILPARRVAKMSVAEALRHNV